MSNEDKGLQRRSTDKKPQSLRDRLKVRQTIIGGNESSKGSLDALRQQAREQKEAVASRDEALVLLLDASISMESSSTPYTQADAEQGKDWPPSKLDAAKEAACALLRLSRRSYTSVVGFSDFGIVLAPLSNRIRSIGAVQGMYTIGRTAMLSGLSEAYNVLAAVGGKYKVRRIILLSDGMPTDAEDHEVIARAESIGRHGIIIDTVAFGEDADRDLMKAIARAARGIMCEADDVAKLIKVFKALEATKRGLLGGRTTP